MTAGGEIATLRAFDEAHLPELMNWFPDRESCLVWGGPEFRFPFTETTFRIDARLANLATRMLVRGGRLVAFGQYYLRVGRCHLGRLAVAPDCRGGGLGKQLVRELCAEGRALLDAGSCSLFVVPTNLRAKALYERLGFEAVPYPEPAPELDPYIYMVTSVDGPRLG
jgi:ribosomal protein S18 acetylase RimI-like enzyme